MYQHHNRQGADIVAEAPKHDPLIKWPIWGHVTVWKIYISIFMRFIANELGRLLTLGRIFITQMLKSSPTSCWNLQPCSQYFGNCRYLTKCFSHTKWNETWLLLTKILSTSWLTSSQVTYNLRKNLKTPWNYSLVSNLLLKMKVLPILAKNY